MGSQALAAVAAFIALSFLLLALAACSTVEQPSVAVASVSIPAEEPAVPEFHGAAIGRDLLRSRLMAEG
jgi:hypothetical protein